MPCRNYDELPPVNPSKVTFSDLEAMLCGICSVLEGYGELQQVLADTDWKEAGVPPEKFQRWWETHKQADKERREREAQNER